MKIVGIPILGAEDCSFKTKEGEWCHFPFTYNRKVYHKCTSDDHDKPWCSTTEKFTYQWGNCKGKKRRKVDNRFVYLLFSFEGHEWLALYLLQASS